MKNYKCPVNPDHEGYLIRETSDDSPHSGQVVCAEIECGEHIKWASKRDMVARETEKAVANNDTEASNALLCPLMSGMVIQPAKSEVRPARLRFEGNACIKEQCTWYVKANDDCSIPQIAISLGTMADWRLK
jgi:hypothetical protein